MHVHGTSALREQIDAVKHLVQWHTYCLWRIPSWHNELQAEATLRTFEVDGRRVWFAEIGDPDAIRVTYSCGRRWPANWAGACPS